ncbi:hypothetical protein [Eubacterium sp.]|uniref:hypothetical protein n=1 Tax=Eubacterium sp. TaxID=142586 RepID=UPI0040286840
MKIDNKKKKIIIIAAVIILVAAIATTVGVLCSKKAKQSENTESQTVTVDVTDENGEIVTDENGKIVTKTEEVKDKTNGDKKTSSDGKDDNGKKNNINSGNNNSNKKDESTTEPLSEYTTNSNKATVLPEISFDGLITDSYAITVLQDYYEDTYVVNYDVPNYSGTKMAFAVFKAGKDKTNIVYTVTVDEETGETIQTDKKGNKTDITDKVDYGQEKQ